MTNANEQNWKSIDYSLNDGENYLNPEDKLNKITAEIATLILTIDTINFQENPRLLCEYASKIGLHELAFQQYKNAAKCASQESACVQGSIEQRLGKCYENDEGCECNLVKAKEHYSRACKYLQEAVDEGDWYYEKVLARTKKSLKRVQQLVI